MGPTTIGSVSTLARLVSAALLATLAMAMPASAAAVQVDCGEHRGVICSGFFTDEAGVVEDGQRIEDAIARLVAEHGNPVAIVIVTDSRGLPPAAFAEELANAWGVGDPDEENGILVLVSLEERRTEVVTQSQVSIAGESVAASAGSFFAAGDFEGGILAMIGTIDQILSGDVVAPGGTTGVSGWIVLAVVVAGVASAGLWIRSASVRARSKVVQRRRARLVDGDLARLEPAGHELPQLADFALPLSGEPVTGSTRDALHALRAFDDRGRAPSARETALLAHHELLVLVDTAAMAAQTREPLELRASQERPLLEDAVQSAAADAVAVDWRSDDAFTVRRNELADLIASLRPHRIAAARRRVADSIIASLVETPLGMGAVTSLGIRLVQAGPALDGDAPLVDSIGELEAAHRVAVAKADRLETLYGLLPASTTRPAVAAALADLDTEPSAAVAAFEQLRTRLESDGGALTSDGLDIPAVAALLLMNNDAGNHHEFLEAYRIHRDSGSEPGEAVEYALAGLLSAGEITRVRTAARRLDLPVAITAALLRRRDDGPEVFTQLRDELAAHVDGDAARTIAGILAVSLEPSSAVRRWVEAHTALSELGLRGTYAEVAAAFGASDPRGPRAFALAYAAQRTALAESSIDDADRFAPELAHEGTRDRVDTWTQRPIPGTLGSFDPFTLFYYHWVITRGHSGSYGWEPVYRHSSWSGDRSSWWGGGGGFGSSGGSSWGGSSWGGGSFGGFGGGGGFSSGGGGGW